MGAMGGGPEDKDGEEEEDGQYRRKLVGRRMMWFLVCRLTWRISNESRHVLSY